MSLALEAKLEALLFWKSEPQSVKKLVQLLELGEEEIRSGLSNLDQQLAGRGLRLISKNDEFTLGTAPELGQLLERLNKDELKTELGRAGMETLTIVAYRAPVAKSEIDYIRGVNSGFTLRHLLIRGLIEKTVNSNDARSFFYQPTFDLMSLLGLVKLDELPEHDEIRKNLEAFLQRDDISTNQ